MNILRQISPTTLCSLTIFRSIRGPSRSVKELKNVKGVVENKVKFNDSGYFEFQKYEDLVKNAESTANLDELKVEEILTTGEDFNAALAKARVKDKSNVLEENRSLIKKEIIKRKYFKQHETCLLTHAAKEQIRYLHSLNPQEWSPEVLSTHFPITVTGVKKLLKSNRVLKCPESIKQHDKKIADNWKALESGRLSDLISSYTWEMWKQGKIIKENYKGIPHLPCRPMPEVIHKEKKKEVGEFLSIVKKYVDYKEKESKMKDNSTGKEIQLQNSSFIGSDKTRINTLKKNRHYIDDESNFTNSYNQKNMSKYASMSVGENEIPFQQFKENLKEEINSSESKLQSKYGSWVIENTQEKKNNVVKAFDTKEFFTKIPKYNKDLKSKQSGVAETPYVHDGNYEHPYPKRKIHNRKRFFSNSIEKQYAYKVGQCVYDEDGELLYRLSS